MNTRGQMLCVWSGVLSIFVFFIGFWPLAKFFPPLSPALSAQEIADYYLANSVGIRLGTICFLYAGAMLMPFYGVISYHMKRIEGEFGPMSIAQLALAVFAVVPFIPAAVNLAAATYRPERDIGDIYLMSDNAWIFFFMVAPPAMFQYFAIAYAILTDRNSQPIFPRWMGWFTIWSAILGVPGAIIVFFYHGPFAWNGLFGFWIPANLFGIWTFIMAWQLTKAIKRQAAEKLA